MNQLQCVEPLCYVCTARISRSSSNSCRAPSNQLRQTDTSSTSPSAVCGTVLHCRTALLSSMHRCSMLQTFLSQHNFPSSDIRPTVSSPTILCLHHTRCATLMHLDISYLDDTLDHIRLMPQPNDRQRNR